MVTVIICKFCDLKTQNTLFPFQPIQLKLFHNQILFLNYTMSAALKFYRVAWRESVRCKDYSTKYFIRRKLRERYRATEPPISFEQSVANTKLDQIKRIVTMSNMYASELSVLEKQAL